MNLGGGGSFVLEQQNAMNGGSAGPPRRADATPNNISGFLGEFGDAIDETPRWLAALLLGSFAALILFRVGGFRFSFGANVGGGT